MEIGLLIGANCLKELEPEERVPSKGSKHFAFRAPLGQCVVGLLTKFGRESSISCNQTVVQDAATGKKHPIILVYPVKSNISMLNRC